MAKYISDEMRSKLITAFEERTDWAEDIRISGFAIEMSVEEGRQVVHEMSAFDKYRWHDLRENAEDLPELDKRVLVCYQIDDATYGYVTWWTDEDDLFSPIVEAIAWSYIDLYEGK